MEERITHRPYAQFDDIITSSQVHQHFQLSLHLLLLDRFQYLDDDELLVDRIITLEHFRVLASSDFSNDFVSILPTPTDLEVIVVPPSFT